MSRFIKLLVIAGVVAGFAIPAASASNAHFVGSPTCSVSNSGNLNCTGKIAGLGNEAATSYITADVTATYVCVNHGGNTAPGQGTYTPSATSSQQPVTSKNGNIIYNNTLQAPTTLSTSQAGCPSGNWTVRRTSLTYSNVTIHILDGNGQEIFSYTYPNSY